MMKSLTILLSLYLAFGLMGCAPAQAGHEKNGIYVFWNMEGTQCAPYWGGHKQIACKTQNVRNFFPSEKECRKAIPEMRKKGYTDLSCFSVSVPEPCGDLVCGP